MLRKDLERKHGKKNSKDASDYCQFSKLVPLHIPEQFLSSQEILHALVPTNCCVPVLK